MERPCYCCGFGGEVSLTDYDMSMTIAGKKVDSIRRSGADGVATGCPACKIHIEDALHHFGVKKPVSHTVEYLARSYRVGPGGLKSGGEGQKAARRGFPY